jgi:hypothetical protein
MRRLRRVRPRVVLLIGSLVLALAGVAQAQCPPEFLFGCSVVGASPLFGLLVGNTIGDGVSAFGDTGIGVFGESNSNIGVSGKSNSAYGVRGLSTSGIGVVGESTFTYGLYGHSTHSNGLYASSDFGPGVFGYSSSGGVGVHGDSLHNDGVVGVAHNDIRAGVSGSHPGAGYGIYGESTNLLGLAGYFYGDVAISGTLSKAAGSFTIDHPLDPANKTLSHSFVESPDMLNIYNGTTLTDAHGNATITLPAYFQALNYEFRYQLTVIEQFAQAMVSSKIQENQFTIKTDKPHVEVSWMVTGVRQDAYANAHRIAVEDEKPAHERGAYLHPEVYGQPKDKGVHQARRAGEARPMTAEAAQPQLVALP